MNFNDACNIVSEAEKLIESIGFKLGRGSTYDRNKIAWFIMAKDGNVTDAAREIIKVGYINHEKAYGQSIYV